MMKRYFILLMLLCCSVLSNAETMNVSAETMKVTRVKSSGPIQIVSPLMINDVDVNSKEFDVKSLLANTPATALGENVPYINICDITHSAGKNIYCIEFALSNSRYAVADIKFEGPTDYAVWVDGEKLSGQKLILEPATHIVVIRYIADEQTKAPEIEMVCTDGTEGTDKNGDEIFSLREDNLRAYTLKDAIHGTRYNSISISKDGKYLITGYTTTLKEGKTESFNKVTEFATGRIIMRTERNISWMPDSDFYYYIADGATGKDIITVDPSTGAESVFAQNIPDGSFQISPDKKYLIYTLTQNGPQERKDVYEVLVPDDRQPGWRQRSYLAKYDLQTRQMQPITFGYNNNWSREVSADSRYMLVTAERGRLGQRPTTLRSLYIVDLQATSTPADGIPTEGISAETGAVFAADTLVKDDGFIGSAIFSPDGKKVLVSGSPEAFDSIGKNVKPGQIPNMYDIQLYIIDVATKEVTPITKDFNPSVLQFVWNKYDNNIYFTAENLDMISLFCYDTKAGKISEIETCEELVNGFSIASEAPVLAYYGQGASNSDRGYIVEMKKGKTTIFEDLSKKILDGIELGECIAWDFVNSKGDTINGRYYLPPHFDPAKKYPLIVNYYGGCSPTSRNFESRYPQHAYAALGYVVYVLNPSGATGFGQEFSARHVNTAGHGPAEDIIEGTKQFCKEHNFVNAEKIGCIGASYGGFMTQYLQTQTDIFAAAISHAGISDHTSYWGEGYWGYSYSEVAMAHSYPWSHQDLYVKQSPLYNAHKVNTPILFLHGDADTNVPVGESIQMYTALKLLGKETAMVLVKDQDHHIKEYEKRIRWQNTIWAWFAKWLQDNPTWWDAMYPPKSL